MITDLKDQNGVEMITDLKDQEEVEMITDLKDQEERAENLKIIKNLILETQ